MDSVLHRHDISDRVAVTAGTVADSTRAPQLTAGIKAEATIADKGCDSQYDAISIRFDDMVSYHAISYLQ